MEINISKITEHQISQCINIEHLKLWTLLFRASIDRNKHKIKKAKEKNSSEDNARRIRYMISINKEYGKMIHLIGGRISCLKSVGFKSLDQLLINELKNRVSREEFIECREIALKKYEALKEVL